MPVRQVADWPAEFAGGGLPGRQGEESAAARRRGKSAEAAAPGADDLRRVGLRDPALLNKNNVSIMQCHAAPKEGVAVAAASVAALGLASQPANQPALPNPARIRGAGAGVRAANVRSLILSTCRPPCGGYVLSADHASTRWHLGNSRRAKKLKSLARPALAQPARFRGRAWHGGGRERVRARVVAHRSSSWVPGPSPGALYSQFAIRSNHTDGQSAAAKRCDASRIVYCTISRAQGNTREGAAPVRR
ncbi:hypothetical protein GGTG_03096 [Gaeumannomyces tritici R3-111a-1]|uniref:Uncharacterized protein n=1 Tax=Gaeumannomyces tritici (strain R3-111a-1) TaxID=644352 RepID=J3NP90_GAET3|nr:hypothetical protein GGTG_03096 [Gaeumannomyces tritici R3-111a-1]EJT77993.1 hypothetical protein GGTG_03096 [Gaeumannomyces tritici R3-111a-1]